MTLYFQPSEAVIKVVDDLKLVLIKTSYILSYNGVKYRIHDIANHLKKIDSAQYLEYCRNPAKKKAEILSQIGNLLPNSTILLTTQIPHQELRQKKVIPCVDIHTGHYFGFSFPLNKIIGKLSYKNLHLLKIPKKDLHKVIVKVGVIHDLNLPPGWVGDSTINSLDHEFFLNRNLSLL